MTEPAKRLFLVDAMAHIYRAFYAPMLRMNAPSGMPTKVPFLFNNILKRILKDYKPEYLGIVFDPSGPTFREKKIQKIKSTPGADAGRDESAVAVREEIVRSDAAANSGGARVRGG